jgi:hypothetical protein
MQSLAYNIKENCRVKKSIRPEEQRSRGAEEQRSRGAEEQRSRGAEEQRSRGVEIDSKYLEHKQQTIRADKKCNENATHACFFLLTFSCRWKWILDNSRFSKVFKTCR